MRLKAPDQSRETRAPAVIFPLPRKAGERLGRHDAPASLRPQLVLRVGVSGHITDEKRLLSRDLPLIEKAISRLLLVMCDALDDVLHRNDDIFAEAPPLLRFVSPLAEGADQAAAKAALAAGANHAEMTAEAARADATLADRAALATRVMLHCPLPFRRRDYAQDFKSREARADFYRLLRRAASVLQLPGDRRDEDEAYETVGLVTLRRSDLLIAVWDGDLKERKRGGTTDMVIRAFESGIPVIWLNPRLPKLEPRLIDKEDLTYGMSLWELVAGGGRRLEDGDLHALVEGLTAPPGSMRADRSTKDTEARARLFAFLSEREHPAPRFWIAYRMLLWLLGGRAPSNESQPEPRGAGASTHKIRNLAPVQGFINLRHGFADRLSVNLGHVYRSSYVMNYFFAAIAVFFALLGLVFHHDLKPVWVGIELVFIFLILAITLVGMRGNRHGGWLDLPKLGLQRRWHERWVDYRQLAEQLRHLRFLSFGGAQASEARLSHISETAKPGPAWSGWYHRATLRELPLLHGRVDEAFVATMNEAILLEIDAQARYHARNAFRLEHVHERLAHGGDRLFATTAVICLAFAAGAVLYNFMSAADRTLLEALFVELVWQQLGYDFEEKNAKDALIDWVTFLGGLLPALGAALYGIRMQGEFRTTAERSAIVAAELSALKAQLKGRPPDSFAKAAALADNVAEIMSAELSDWSMIFREKPLSLPV